MAVIPSCPACAETDDLHGHQDAIIGSRSIALCQTCDAHVLQASLRLNQPVPDGYVAAYRQPRHHPRGGQAPSRARPPAVPAPTLVSTSRSKTRTVAGRTPPRSRSAVPASAPAAHTDPTIRQAVAAVMEERTELDATTVLLLSTHVGTTTCLSHLDGPAGTTTQTTWVNTTWPDATSIRGHMARATLRALVDDWKTRGWLQRDIAAGLREKAH